MPMNPQMGGAQAMAGGMPPMPSPGGPGGQASPTTVTPGGTSTTQITEIMESLKKVVPQTIDERGYVDMDRLIQMWPQFSQVPFQVVMQLIQQNPEILNQLITQYGLAGIIVQGRVIGADELASLGGKGGG